MADERGARAADSPGVPALPGPLVDAGWLRRHSADVAAGRLVLVDVRWYLDGRSGHDAFLTGHLPGARWVDLDAELSSPATPTNGRHPLPSPAVFAAAMRRLGVDDTTPVVAYDDASGSVAARLWWLLRVHDHPVAVLDGGLGAWPPEGLERGAALPVAHLGTFRERPWPERRFVDADRVDDLRKDLAALVLDARATARYEQGDLAVDPRRGHVPGARSAPWIANTTDGPGSALRPAAELHDRFVGLGAGEARSVVCYCGSGVTACHDLLALELAGFGDRTALYPGSWSQWGADITRPAATGPDPGPRDR